MATKSQIAEYTEQSMRGFNGEEFEGLYTSPMHACHCIGAHFRATGRPAPTDVRVSRGDTIKVRDMLFRLYWNDVKHPNIVREY